MKTIVDSIIYKFDAFSINKTGGIIMALHKEEKNG